VVRTADYTAYGQVISTTGSTSTPFGYAGEYTDAETGFLYLRARFYDPATQQFLTVDPLLAATEQAYNYAGGSPTNAIDSAGLACVPTSARDTDYIGSNARENLVQFF
jgi:RHS repeat-associated protein